MAHNGVRVPVWPTMVLECQYGSCKYEEENEQLKKSLPKCFQHAKS